MPKDASDARRELIELDDPTNLEATADDEKSGAQPIPTIIPEFDPQLFAEASEVRERMPTLVDEESLEQARLASLPSNFPPPLFSTSPGPIVVDDDDSLVEIDTDEAEIDVFEDDEQAAILRARLTPLSRVPTLTHKLTELGALLEDPKTAYVLGFVDGILPLDTIIDVTGLPELDTLRVLDRMVSHGIVIFRPSRANVAVRKIT
ncbi:hypothetical protein AKJ09_03898 [Labilithrix luteola]|uniref:Uncharacterized protein n=1 Tax=Labilithrix luteola TaxID=1391654 RepID=A0A0K1PVU4_9BACT|nr:hypothetical protein [Labilithrix luteola]AKU97234.1 hypothetical protein AKJ09_03898 [Labilithrix luteola]